MKSFWRAFFPVLVLVMLSTLVSAQESSTPTRPEDVAQVDSGTIKEILKSDLILLDNNKRYRLDNILAPPFEDTQALEELKRKFLNKKVTIYTYHDPDKNFDRYGVPLAHVISDDDHVWIQEDLVAKGLAWAYSTETSRLLVDTLKEIEEKARNRKAGFWANPEYAIKTPESVKGYANSYQIVEGKILNVTVKPNTTFINFGKDWNTDFTIRIPKKTGNNIFSQQTGQILVSVDPSAWKNHWVRIRGWVEENKGPTIELTHNEQLEHLPDPEE
jgi:micrococcal nuclease